MAGSLPDSRLGGVARCPQARTKGQAWSIYKWVPPHLTGQAGPTAHPTIVSRLPSIHRSSVRPCTRAQHPDPPDRTFAKGHVKKGLAGLSGPVHSMARSFVTPAGLWRRGRCCAWKAWRMDNEFPLAVTASSWYGFGYNGVSGNGLVVKGSYPPSSGGKLQECSPWPGR